jgi:hypothetical protein
MVSNNFIPIGGWPEHWSNAAYTSLNVWSIEIHRQAHSIRGALLDVLPAGVDRYQRMAILTADPMNLVSLFIEINNGVRLRKGFFTCRKLVPLFYTEIV